MSRLLVWLARPVVCGAFIIAIGGCASSPLATSLSPLVSPVGRFTPALVGPVRMVVIDAGHGGHDPGTSHFGLEEKHTALDIAKRLRTLLQHQGLTVVMTREADQFISLSGRPELANRLEADLFISVHINANHNRQVSGVEVYYPRESVVSDAAQWPQAVSPSEIGVPSATVRQLLWDLVLGRTRSQSRRLASAICRSMREALGVPCRGIRAARFVVLREARMPAVLVEVGYVSNQAEATRLGRADYRQAAADSIARGIVSYVRELGAQHI